MKKIKSSLIAAICGLALAAGAETGAGASIPWRTQDYTLIAREMSMREALETFAVAQGLSVMISPAAAGSVISGEFKELPPGEFLDRIATINNLVWYYDGATLYVYTTSESVSTLLNLKYMQADEVRSLLAELNVEDKRFPIRSASDGRLLMISGPPRYVQLIAEMVARADALREQRTFSEIEVRVFPLKHTWADNVSLSVSGAESTTTIRGVAQILQDMMSGNRDSNTHEKKPGESAEAGAEDVDARLSEAMSRNVKPMIVAENRLNAVLVRDVQGRMPIYEQIIKQLDVPQRLVEITITSLEMSRDDALDWAMSLKVTANNDHVSGGGGQNLSSLVESTDDLTGRGLAGAASYIDKYVNIQASLTALRDKGKARNISRTSLLTMNNLAAQISDNQSYHARVVGKEVATLQEVSAGTSLSVKPRIVSAPKTADTNQPPDQIWLTLKLSDGGFESVVVDSMPMTYSSTLTTQAALYENDSLLLVGYLRNIVSETAWGIPYLRDIPFIGWLFGGVSKRNDSLQRMFILTPRIIDIAPGMEIAREQATWQRNIDLERTLDSDKTRSDDEETRKDDRAQDEDEKAIKESRKRDEEEFADTGAIKGADTGAEPAQAPLNYERQPDALKPGPAAEGALEAQGATEGAEPAQAPLNDERQPDALKLITTGLVTPEPVSFATPEKAASAAETPETIFSTMREEPAVLKGATAGEIKD